MRREAVGGNRRGLSDPRTLEVSPPACLVPEPLPCTLVVKPQLFPSQRDRASQLPLLQPVRWTPQALRTAEENRLRKRCRCGAREGHPGAVPGPLPSPGFVIGYPPSLSGAAGGSPILFHACSRPGLYLLGLYIAGE